MILLLQYIKIRKISEVEYTLQFLAGETNFCSSLRKNPREKKY